MAKLIKGLPRYSRNRMVAVRRVKSRLPAKEYIKVGDGFLMNTHYADGAPVRLNERQAKYPLLHGLIRKK